MTTLEDRRPITLLNTDYKLVTRMIAQRLKPILEKHFSKTQFCCVLGNNILDAVAKVRDTIAFAEYTNTLQCVMALDFEQAFDNISHEHLFSILRSYGLTEIFTKLICNLYRDATSTVQINGRLHGPIPIKCGVRQGCPLSMALYTLCLQPFLNMLAERLIGFKIGRERESVSVVAYADDVTLFLTSDTDRKVIEEAIQLFEMASGARLNSRKSSALPIGRWKTFDTVRDIEYRPSIKILGVIFWTTVQKSATDKWTQLTGQVRMLARESFT
jgi:hypothetical protein